MSSFIIAVRYYIFLVLQFFNFVSEVMSANLHKFCRHTYVAQSIYDIIKLYAYCLLYSSLTQRKNVNFSYLFQIVTLWVIILRRWKKLAKIPFSVIDFFTHLLCAMENAKQMQWKIKLQQFPKLFCALYTFNF